MSKKIVSILLLTVMVISVAGNALASDWEKEWQELQKNIGIRQSPLESPEEVERFRQLYWDHLFPIMTKIQPNRKPPQIQFNPEGVGPYDLMYYGWASLIKENTYDSKGAPVYLGYTYDNRYVSNMMFNAQPWKNPRLLDRDMYVDGPLQGTKFHGGINPFKTDYNSPRQVGQAYLGKDATETEQIDYGRQIIEKWARNVKNRPEIGWYKDKAYIYQIPEFQDGNGNFDLDKFLKYFTITVPPTSRTNGQCLAWFTSDAGRLTHRTFYIAPTKPIDFEATRCTWDEPTKTLTVCYKIHGLEKVEGELASALYQGGYIKEEFIDKSIPGFVDVSSNWMAHAKGPLFYYNIGNNEDASFDKAPNERVFLIMHKVINDIKKNLNIEEYTVKFRMPYLKSERDEDIELTAYINASHAFPEYAPNAYDNNQIKVIIPATVKKTPDLIVDKIDPGATETKPNVKHSGKVYISRAPREGQETDEPIDTILYLSIANGKLDTAVDTPVSLKPGESKEVPFTWEAGTDKDKNILIVAEINPEKLGTSRLPERTYENNKKSVVVKMQQDKVDLSIELGEFTNALYVNETDTFGVQVFSTSDKPLTTDIIWKFAGKQVRKANITVPAKGKAYDKVNLTMPNVKENQAVVLEVEVNPSRNKPANEITFANNKIKEEVYCMGVDDEPLSGASDPYLVK
jgi:hypothetical protein